VAEFFHVAVQYPRPGWGRLTPFPFALLSFADFKDIESYCLAQWAALTNCNKIAQLDISETGRQMSSKILMSFLKSVVLLDVMKIIPSDYNCSLHLHALYSTRQYSTPDADIASKRAFLVYVCAINSLSRCFESKAYISYKSLLLCFGDLSYYLFLVLEYWLLFLISSLRLFGTAS